MKQRNLFIDKFYLQHKTVIWIISNIVLLVCGFLVTFNIINKPISDSKFAFYEQVAYDVYKQGSKAIYEVPEEVFLEKTSTSIIIFSANRAYRGKVIARLQNGELVYIRESEKEKLIILSSLIGMLCACIGNRVLIHIGEKIKKHN